MPAQTFPLILKENEDFSEIEFFRDIYFQFQLYKLEATIHYDKEDFNKALVAINKDIEYMERFSAMDEGELIVDSYSFKSKILNKDSNKFLPSLKLFYLILEFGYYF